LLMLFKCFFFLHVFNNVLVRLLSSFCTPYVSEVLEPVSENIQGYSYQNLSKTFFM